MLLATPAGSADRYGGPITGVVFGKNVKIVFATGYHQLGVSHADERRAYHGDGSVLEYRRSMIRTVLKADDQEARLNLPTIPKKEERRWPRCAGSGCSPGVGMRRG